MFDCTALPTSEFCLGYALLAKSKPARDPTLRLRRLPLHSLVKIIHALIQLLFGIILSLVELGRGVVLEPFEFGLGLAHFGRYSFVRLMNLVTNITNLYVVLLLAWRR